MKKGDLRRQAILDTAEALFFQRGYEETSVQDILDAMGLSKGGFYHHFESKMSVLEAVSARRAEKKFTQAARELRASSLGALEKLNRLFSLVSRNLCRWCSTSASAAATRRFCAPSAK